MRKTLSTLLGVSLATAGTLTAVIQPAQAAAPVTAVAQQAGEPYSKFKISVSSTKRTKRGGKILYKIRAKNLGPHYADYFWIGGQVPKGVVPTLRWGGAKGTKCTWEGRMFWCWGKYALEVGDTEWLNFQVTMKRNTKGVAVARLGVVAFDVPLGAERLDEEELERIGIKGWQFLKTAKTKIVWPPRRPTRGWTPPPVVKEYNPPAVQEESNKKKDT
ncbi:hypothetical protein [Nonomuraea typhae]|uniref:DUF11 domain-containing protein n=1 Tax=Nonomuraea typhae TaxID=2603600 RepID=A0ABW7Z2B0_9ACTN